MRKPRRCGVAWVFCPHKIGLVFHMAKYIVHHGIRIATDFVPQTFGRLTTIGPVFRTGKIHRQVCLCVCDTIGVYQLAHLKANRTRSCGCLRKEELRRRARTHGMSKTPEYVAWCGMIHRCYNQNCEDYADYGGRGISVWENWLGDSGFAAWFAYMGTKPHSSTSQDRFPNPNGNYEPGNVRWTTNREQANNRRGNHLIEYLGKTQTLSQWARELGLSPKVLSDRIHAGWDLTRAFTQILQKQKPKKRKCNVT